MPGNLLGLALSPVLLAALGWRSLFYIFGAVGAPLLALWLAVVPARATRSEPGASAPCSTLDLLGSSATWAIIVSAPITATCMPAWAVLCVRGRRQRSACAGRQHCEPLGLLHLLVLDAIVLPPGSPGPCVCGSTPVLR